MTTSEYQVAGVVVVLLLVLGAALLHNYRVRLIADHRRLARSIIIDYSSLGFWADVQKMNSYGSWDDMFYDIRRWKFSQFYPGLLQESGKPCHYLGAW